MPLAYRVNPGRYSRACLDGVWTAATNDIGIDSSEFFVDSEFLASLPSYGRKAVDSLEHPPTDAQKLFGRVQMDIIGVLRDVTLTVFFDAADESERPQEKREVVADQLYVVRSLPAPLHVSHKHIAPPPHPKCPKIDD